MFARVLNRWQGLGLLGLALNGFTPGGALQAGGVVTNSSLASLYAALLGGGQVTFSPSADLAFALVAPLEIQSDTILDASATARSVTFNGGSKVRLFNVNPGVTLTLLEVNLSNGQSTNGGGIYNQGTVIATNCVFKDNRAAGIAGATGTAGSDDPSLGDDGKPGGSGGTARGGAIYNLGAVALRGCRLEANQATGGDGGTGGAGGGGLLRGGHGGDGGAAGEGQGGAVYSTGTTSFVECAFPANTATGGDGGAGGAAGAGAEISPSRAGVAQPGAAGLGGAVYSLGAAALTACTFSTNTVSGGVAADEGEGEGGFGREGRVGGGARGGAVFNGGTLALVNATFSSNAGTGGEGGAGGSTSLFRGGRGGDGGAALGGGLWNQGTAAATNCTFVAGTATGGAGGAGGTHGSGVTAEVRSGDPGEARGGNLANDSGATLSLASCLLADSGSGGNGSGNLGDRGYNLSTDSSCQFSAAGSLNDTTAGIGALGDFGGPTQTVPLLAGSAAINGGESLPGILVDQRGIVRPQGLAADIGAFERAFSGLSGRVTRPGGSPIAGVTISLLSATSPPVTTETGTDGSFEFIQLPGVDLGVYRVAAPGDGGGFTPPFYDVQLSSASQSITNLDFVSLGDRIVTFGLTTNGTFQLRLEGEPGRTYRIEGSAAFGPWTTLGQGSTGTNGWLDFEDPSPATGDMRFYRTVTP